MDVIESYRGLDRVNTTCKPSPLQVCTHSGVSLIIHVHVSLSLSAGDIAPVLLMLP